jgi:hypothetical protein
MTEEEANPAGYNPYLQEQRDRQAYLKIGTVLGILVGGLTFFGCWIYAIQSWGWFLGIAFGWVPSAIIAVIAGVLTVPLWGFMLAGIALLLLSMCAG